MSVLTRWAPRVARNSEVLAGFMFLLLYHGVPEPLNCPLYRATRSSLDCSHGSSLLLQVQQNSLSPVCSDKRCFFTRGNIIGRATTHIFAVLYWLDASRIQEEIVQGHESLRVALKYLCIVTNHVTEKSKRDSLKLRSTLRSYDK